MRFIMLLVVYDISSDKLRNRFSKFLTQYGRRLQFSVFEIQNSPRILQNIRTEIQGSFQKRFQQSDSVLIMDVPDQAVIDRYGYAKNEEQDLLIF